MGKNTTPPSAGTWEAQKAETREYIEQHKAWYEKNMTPEQLANLQQAVAPSNGGKK